MLGPKVFNLKFKKPNIFVPNVCLKLEVWDIHYGLNLYTVPR